MVQVILANPSDHTDYGGGQPLIHVHHVARDVHGNGIAIRVYGEMKIAAKEVVFAKELKLNTIQVLVLTPEAPMADIAYTAQKWIYHKGEYDNYASIDVFKHLVSDGTCVELTAVEGSGPYDGSIWLNFIALGE